MLYSNVLCGKFVKMKCVFDCFWPFLSLSVPSCRFLPAVAATVGASVALPLCFGAAIVSRELMKYMCLLVTQIKPELTLCTVDNEPKKAAKNCSDAEK